MLKALVLVLVLALANVVFFVWSLGWLDPIVGLRARGDREPERLAQQVRPETLVILQPSASSAAVPLSCLEAGPFNEAELPLAQTALQDAAPGAWSDIRSELTGRWIVYLGRFPAREVMARRGDELKRRGVAFDEIRGSKELEPGLSLGTFDDRAQAEQALAGFSERGIRNGKVVEETPASTMHVLRVASADAALAAQLMALTLNVPGKAFGPCASVAAAKP